MELKDTVELMTSSDFKDRFRAEWLQLSIRYEKLKNMIRAWDNGELTFTPTCPRSLYDFQLNAMKDYLMTLEIRAEIEDIIL